MATEPDAVPLQQQVPDAVAFRGMTSQEARCLDPTAALSAALGAAGLLDGDRLTDAGRPRRDGLEATTDAMEQSIVGPWVPTSAP